MNFTLPDLASTPPVPGEHGYYHSYNPAQAFRTTDGARVNFSVKDRLNDKRAWVTYTGTVPDKLTPIKTDPMKSWYYY